MAPTVLSFLLFPGAICHFMEPSESSATKKPFSSTASHVTLAPEPFVAVPTFDLRAPTKVPIGAYVVPYFSERRARLLARIRLGPLFVTRDQRHPSLSRSLCSSETRIKLGDDVRGGPAVMASGWLRKRGSAAWCKLASDGPKEGGARLDDSRPRRVFWGVRCCFLIFASRPWVGSGQS